MTLLLLLLGTFVIALFTYDEELRRWHDQRAERRRRRRDRTKDQ